METIEQFKQEQAKTIEILERLLEFVKEGQRFDVTDKEGLLTKISAGINDVKSSKLKVVLVGGFSEGKTSIAAAWSGNYDPDTMKIDISESSDEVQVYHLSDFDLIDTPGLFGFKETENQVKYKEITRRYVSEANLLLYVMSPNNPIKNSHKAELNWLFKDLNLLSRVVFVLSRFDEEVDLEDKDEYQERLKIKKENIMSRLRDFGIISESQEVPIVAVAANPFGEGFEYWLLNIEEYNEISHIPDLQIATTNQIKNSGGENALVLATSQSIIKDVIQKQMPIVQQKMVTVVEEINRFKDAMSDIQKEQNKSEKSINAARLDLKDYITELFTDLILQVKGTDMQTIEDFFEKNIGDEGIVLETNIQNEFERQLGKISHEISKTEINFDASLSHYNSMVGDLTLKGIKAGGEFLKNTKVSNNTVLAARKFLMPSFKFKPWGAIKLASNISKGVNVVSSFIGIGLELWDSYSEVKKQEKFKEMKNSIKESLSEQRKDYIEFINNSDQFFDEFFPEYNNLLSRINEMEMEMTERESFINEFRHWELEGKSIEADFEVIS